MSQKISNLKNINLFHSYHHNYFILRFSCNNYVLKPYLALIWYKKQGIPIFYFFPFFGPFKLFADNLKNQKDSLYVLKVLKEKENSPKIYSMNFGTSALLFIDDPALIKECLLNNHLLLCKAGMITNNLGRFLGKKNLGFGEGKEWKKSRKIITTSFTFDFLKENVTNIAITAEEKLQKIKNCRDVDLKYLMENITGQSFMRIFFESDLAEFIYEGKPLFSWIVDIIYHLDRQSMEIYYLLFGEKYFKLGLRESDRKLNRDIKNIRNIFIEHVKEQKKKSNFLKNSLLANLIRNEDLLKEDGFVDVFERIADEMLLLFFAGTDTTSLLTLNALLLLSQNPQTLNKLVDEIDQNIKDDNSLEYDVLNKLDYLTAVIKETLRINGPGNLLLMRVADKTFKIGDFIIKKDTLINFPLICNHYDKKHFPEPFLFQPERWLESAKINLNQIDSYVYLPFSAGPRNCIGKHLAMLEAKIILVKFLKKYRYEVKNKDVTMELKFLYEPSEPLLIDISSR